MSNCQCSDNVAKYQDNVEKKEKNPNKKTEIIFNLQNKISETSSNDMTTVDLHTSPKPTVMISVAQRGVEK